MTDRSNLHLTGSAGWCQFRRIIAPFSSSFSVFLLYTLQPSSRRISSVTVFQHHSLTLCSLCLFSIFAYNWIFLEITNFLKCVSSLNAIIWKWRKIYFWKVFSTLEKISNRITVIFCVSHSRKKKYKNIRIIGRGLYRLKYWGSWHILSMSPHVRVSDTHCFTCSYVTLETWSSNIHRHSARPPIWARFRVDGSCGPRGRTIGRF